MSKHPHTLAATARAAAIAALALLLAGCGKSATPAATASDNSETADEPGISLSVEEMTALGLTTAAVRPSHSTAEVRGFAAVLPHEAIAQVVADLHTAQAGVQQSRAAVERVKQLDGTAGAMAAETRDTAERQAAADRAALELAQQRLSAALGQDPPWKESAAGSELEALASGKAKLVRITLPVEAVGDRLPASIRIARIDAAQGGKSWHLQSIWRAPGDAATPGVSLFALLNGGELAEGERLLAWIPAGPLEAGVTIPAAAAVVTGGKFFFYIERKPGTFERVEFDPGRAIDGGYFTSSGITAGEKVVVTGAGQLLAREINPSKEAE